MFRISIAGLIGLIVLAALNFAVLRSWAELTQVEEPVALLVGLIPLFDGFVISAYLAITPKYRFRWRRRERPGGFAGVFAVTTAIMQALMALGCVAMTSRLVEFYETAANPVTIWLESLGHPPGSEYLFGMELCLVMSGPPLAVAAVFAWFMRRYELVVTRREPGD